MGAMKRLKRVLLAMTHLGAVTHSLSSRRSHGRFMHIGEGRERGGGAVALACEDLVIGAARSYLTPRPKDRAEMTVDSCVGPLDKLYFIRPLTNSQLGLGLLGLGLPARARAWQLPVFGWPRPRLVLDSAGPRLVGAVRPKRITTVSKMDEKGMRRRCGWLAMSANTPPWPAGRRQVRGLPSSV